MIVNVILEEGETTEQGEYVGDLILDALQSDMLGVAFGVGIDWDVNVYLVSKEHA